MRAEFEGYLGASTPTSTTNLISRADLAKKYETEYLWSSGAT